MLKSTQLGHGKKILNRFTGKTFPTLEAGGRFFFVSSGKSPGNHKQECKSAGLVASYRSSTAAVVACSTNNGEKR